MIDRVFTSTRHPTPSPLTGRSIRRCFFLVYRAFTEYYEGPKEFSAGVAEGVGVLKSTWERALANGKFEEADVEQLTDW